MRISPFFSLLSIDEELRDYFDHKKKNFTRYNSPFAYFDAFDRSFSQWILVIVYPIRSDIPSAYARLAYTRVRACTHTCVHACVPTHMVLARFVVYRIARAFLKNIYVNIKYQPSRLRQCGKGILGYGAPCRVVLSVKLGATERRTERNFEKRADNGDEIERDTRRVRIIQGFCREKRSFQRSFPLQITQFSCKLDIMPRALNLCACIRERTLDLAFPKERIEKRPRRPPPPPTLDKIRPNIFIPTIPLSPSRNLPASRVNAFPQNCTAPVLINHSVLINEAAGPTVKHRRIYTRRLSGARR
ncbi:hypothetical protein PUN28_001082 [Cardiocondyla obscurior]|uniref:Uncharacterized protein n=1 Tax=Cardiocondyla obscurior TaxID=286306 RepID=A0AAW2H2V1_9HYME